MGRAVQLHPVVAGVQGQPVARGDAGDVRDIADNVSGLRQGLGHLGRDKRVVTGAEARDMKDAAHVSASGLRPWPWTKTIAK